MDRLTTATPALDIMELVNAALFASDAALEISIKNDHGSFKIARTGNGLEVSIHFETSEGSGSEIVQCDQRSLNFGERIFFICPKSGACKTKLYIAGGELASADALSLRFPSQQRGELVNVTANSSRNALVVAQPRALAPLSPSRRQRAAQHFEESDRFGDHRFDPGEFLSTEIGCQDNKPVALTAEQVEFCRQAYEIKRIEHSVQIRNLGEKPHFSELGQISAAALTDLGVFKLKPGCVLDLSFLMKFGRPFKGRVIHDNVSLKLFFDLQSRQQPVMRFILEASRCDSFRVGAIRLMQIERRWHFVCPSSHKLTRTLHLHPEGMLESFKGLGLRETAYMREKAPPKTRSLQAF